MKVPEKLYEGNMRKKYLLYALPLILSALLSQSYSFINSMMIGHFIGSEAFAATAATAQLIDFVSSTFWGYLSGIGIYVSVLFGKGAYDKILNVIKINLLLSTIVSIAVSILGNVFCEQIFTVFKVDELIYQEAQRYFRVYVCGYLFFQFNWGFLYISNGMGMTKLPMIASLVSGVFNVLFNYVFLGCLGKGIEYSALSSILSTALIAIIYMVFYIRLFKAMGVKQKGIQFSRSALQQSMSYGAPTMFQQMIMYGGGAMISPLVNTCPIPAISGYDIANKARTLLLAVYQNSGKANTTLVAQAMGAGRIDKIKQGIKLGVTQGLALFGLCMGLFLALARPFAQLFLDPVLETQSVQVSVNIIQFLLPLSLFNVFNNLFHGIFRSVGSGMLMFVSTLIYAVAFVCYTFLLFDALPYEWRIYSVHIAQGGAYITECLFTLIIYWSGKWKTPQYRAMEERCRA